MVLLIEVPAERSEQQHFILSKYILNVSQIICIYFIYLFCFQIEIMDGYYFDILIDGYLYTAHSH